MKDKLIKTHLTKFDRIVNNMRKFSLTLLLLGFISFIPLNNKLNTSNKVIEAEILALKEEQDDKLAIKEINLKEVAKFTSPKVLKK